MMRHLREFLEREYPDRAKHVMSVIRSMRGGKDYDSNWGTRMKGEGPYAWQIGRRFEIACRRVGLNAARRSLRTDLFKPPVDDGGQLQLL
jgi:DNA repair photolyase